MSAASQLRVPELRVRLAARGLPTNGLKAELVARLEAAGEPPAKKAKVGTGSKSKNNNDRPSPAGDADGSQTRRQLVRALGGREAGARPAVGGPAPQLPQQPLVRVAAHGALGLPLNAAAAAALVLAHPSATPGCWHLGKEALEIGNKAFEDAVARLAAEAMVSLGLEPEGARVEVAGLVVHGPGETVLPPAGGGAVGRLLIQLPSVFQGGQLAVLHGGKEVAAVQMDQVDNDGPSTV
jgi:hypothetical protein